jgi:hypothetical protein
MSKVPRAANSLGTHILAQASRFADSPELIRHNVITSMIGQSRSEVLEIEEQIYAAAGYQNANEYWHVAMSEPMKATKFSHLLAIHMLNPTERLSEFDRRSMAQRLIESALRLALKTDENWFIKAGPSAGLADVMVHPRKAAEWLLSMPKRKCLVPPGLRAFLEANKLLQIVQQGPKRGQLSFKDEFCQMATQLLNGEVEPKHGAVAKIARMIHDLPVGRDYEVGTIERYIRPVVKEFSRKIRDASGK